MSRLLRLAVVENAALDRKLRSELDQSFLELGALFGASFVKWLAMKMLVGGTFKYLIEVLG